MSLTLVIGACAAVATLVAAGLYFVLSALAARADEMQNVQYSVLRSFLHHEDEDSSEHEAVSDRRNAD